MELATISVPLHVKFAGEGQPVGYFEGYGAVFGNVDRGGDMIEPGAFAKGLAQMEFMGLKPALYYNHDRASGAVGVWDSVSEDKNGLAVKGRLIGLDTDQGRMNLARLKEGAVGGLSIGYSIPPGGYRRGSGKNGEPSRYLKQVNVHEISIVDDPMNPQAKLNFVKSFGAFDPFNPRELEKDLRDAGLSRAEAKIAVGIFQKSLRRDAEDAGEKVLRDEVTAAEALKKCLSERFGALAKTIAHKKD